MTYKIIWRNEADRYSSQSAFLAEVVGIDCYIFQIAPYDERKRKRLSHYFDLEALKALQTKLNKYLKE